MPSMDATFHSAQDLIYALQNIAPTSPLVTIGNGRKEASRTLEEIFRKANPPGVTPRVPVREVVQKKLQELNQEGTQIKIASQSKPFTDEEHHRVPISEVYPEEF